MKTILHSFFTFSRSTMLAATSLFAVSTQAVSTSYINASGTSDAADCTEITSSSTMLNTGWYVVNGTVNISSYVTVNGDVANRRRGRAIFPGQH